MLFDLRGRRKRLIQAIYLGLALLMGGGLVLFGIGGSVSGGLFDAIGITGNGANRGANFSKQAEKLEARAKLRPKDPRLRSEIARQWYLAGNDAADRKDGQIVGFSQKSADAFAKAAASWEVYVKLVKRPNVGLATFMATAYGVLNDAKGAADAQQIVADRRSNPTTYFDLARYRYFAGQVSAADAAAKKAVAMVTRQVKREHGDRGIVDQLRTQLKQIRKQAAAYVKAQKQQNKANPQQNPFSSPLGGSRLGG